MADNVAITAGSGTNVASDDIGGVQHQRVKVEFGADGSATDVSAANPLPSHPYAIGAGAFYPDPIGAYKPLIDNQALHPLILDGEGNLAVRGAVTTAEGSERDDFSGASLSIALTGTSVTLTNGSKIITGVGTAFLTQLRHDDYVKLDADGATAWAQIQSVSSDTSATLASAYTGTGGTGAAAYAGWRGITGTGGSITVSSSLVNVVSGTTIAANTYIWRDTDYGPLAVGFLGVTLSQRIANQDFILGFHDVETSPRIFARFRFTGTSNTSVICETGVVNTGTPAAADTDTTTVTLGSTTTTAVARNYRVEYLAEYVRYYVDDVMVAEHRIHLTLDYDTLGVIAGVINGGSAPASTTTLAINAINVRNENQLAVRIFSTNENVVATNAPAVTLTGSAAANNTDLLVIDCLQYRTILLQASGTFVGTVTVAASNDVTFTASIAPPMYPAAGGAAVTTFTAVGHWIIPVTARYLRLRTTAYTSGAINITAVCTQQPAALGQVTANATLQAATVMAGDVGLGARATTTNSLTRTSLVAAGSTNASVAKGSAGRLYAWSIANTTASWRYLKLHNASTTPTAGAGVVQTIAVAPNSVNSFDLGIGVFFSTGISFTTVTGAALTDATAVTANDMIIDLYYA